MDTFSDFLVWEEVSKDAIDFKRIYVDMADDLMAGVMLSQIVYWYLPDKHGNPNKLRVQTEDGQAWLVVSREEWWNQCRLKPRQADRTIKLLKEKGIIKTIVLKFNGAPTTHIQLDQENFIRLFATTLWKELKERGHFPDYDSCLTDLRQYAAISKWLNAGAINGRTDCTNDQLEKYNGYLEGIEYSLNHPNEVTGGDIPF